MRRRHKALALLAACLMSACFTFWLASWQPAPQHRISYASFERISSGMRLAELEEAFGVPPGDYSTRPVTAGEPGETFVKPGLNKDALSKMRAAA
jgi:hypothetical protein